MEQLQENASRKRRALELEVTETLTAEIELDKTAEAFRLAHREREELIGQWEQTIEQMRRRDQDMDKCATVSPNPGWQLTWISDMILYASQEKKLPPAAQTTGK